MPYPGTEQGGLQRDAKKGKDYEADVDSGHRHVCKQKGDMTTASSLHQSLLYTESLTVHIKWSFVTGGRCSCFRETPQVCRR